MADNFRLKLLARTGVKPPVSSRNPSAPANPPVNVEASASSVSPQSAQSELEQKIHAIVNELNQQLNQFKTLERTHSQQAGQLLKRLQQQNHDTSVLTNLVKALRSARKRLLSRITNPRWEVRHTYFMTAFEHSLGHKQAHVIDVGELLPGHLRIYAIAKHSVLTQKMLMSSLTKLKSEQQNQQQSLKFFTDELTETRERMKQVRLFPTLVFHTHGTWQARDLIDLSKRLMRFASSSSSESLSSMTTSDPTIPVSDEDVTFEQLEQGLAKLRQELGQQTPSSQLPAMQSTQLRLRYLSSLNVNVTSTASVETNRSAGSSISLIDLLVPRNSRSRAMTANESAPTLLSSIPSPQLLNSSSVSATESDTDHSDSEAEGPGFDQPKLPDLEDLDESLD